MWTILAIGVWFWAIYATFAGQDPITRGLGTLIVIVSIPFLLAAIAVVLQS